MFVVHPDNFVEAFADKNIDIHFARVPQSFSLEGERQAEELTEMMLPKRFRDLYRADKLRKTGTTRPLLPSTLRQSLGTNDLLKLLNDLPNKMKTAAVLPDNGPAIDHEAAIQRARR